MATCARKVLHVAHETASKFEYIEVERSYLTTSEYRRINPAGLVPALVCDDGEVLTESSLIMRYLDDTSPSPGLQPRDPLKRARMNGWLKLVDERYFAATGALTVATYIRSLLGDPLDEAKLSAMLAAIPDEDARQFREQAVRFGLNSAPGRHAVAALPNMLLNMETALKNTEWLADDTLSLADSAIFPLMLRLHEMGLSELWTEHLPRVSDWWRRIMTRPATKEVLRRADDKVAAALSASTAQIRPLLISALEGALAT